MPCSVLGLKTGKSHLGRPGGFPAPVKVIGDQGVMSKISVFGVPTCIRLVDFAVVEHAFSRIVFFQAIKEVSGFIFGTPPCLFN
jgi:hypothetical protein